MELQVLVILFCGIPFNPSCLNCIAYSNFFFFFGNHNWFSIQQKSFTEKRKKMIGLIEISCISFSINHIHLSLAGMEVFACLVWSEKGCILSVSLNSIFYKVILKVGTWTNDMTHKLRVLTTKIHPILHRIQGLIYA